MLAGLDTRRAIADTDVMTIEIAALGKPLGPLRSVRRGRRTDLAEKLIAARLERELSQSEAAAEIGVHRSEYALWESRRGPRLALVQRVVDLWLAGRWPVKGA